MSTVASSRPKTVVLVGNPRPASRTRAAAEAVARTLDTAHHAEAPTAVIELADLLTDLAIGHRSATAEVVDAVTGAELLVIATPVYKGSYTGLLKLFLDQLPSGGLQEVTTVVVTVAAADSHRLLADLHLRPVLQELGATVPTASLTLTEAQLPEIALVASEWALAAAPVVHTVVNLHRAAAGRAA